MCCDLPFILPQNSLGAVQCAERAMRARVPFADVAPLWRDLRPNESRPQGDTVSDFSFTSTHGGGSVSIPPLFYRCGDKLLQQDPPEGRYEPEVWDEGKRKVQVIGITPMYKAPAYRNPGVLEETHVVEFIVVGSKKLEGCRAQGFYKIPKAWDDPRARFGQLASALLGHKIEDGESFSIKEHILKRTTIEVKFDQVLSDGGNLYMKPVSHDWIVTDDDDEIPVADSGFAFTATGSDDGVPDDFVADDGADDIPF
jgi:hypothetical protein